MSEIKVNSIKGVGASTAAITVNNTDGTCTANITNNLSNRNLIINGAMQVAQRGTSSTSGNYATVDRFKLNTSGTDEAPTQAQVDVGSSDLPFTKGLTKAYKITNGNQTSGAGSGDRVVIQHRLEAQNIRNSGWNYTSTSSYVTLSFYVKSSVAQNFFGKVKTSDGTSQNYPFETGSLSADTWTKITKTIPGNSNLQFDNNNAQGLEIEFTIFRGTDETGSVTLNQWAAFSSSTHTPDNTSTWYTTDDATFEITGVQLEVGSVATDFEHRSFGQELALCQRYFERIVVDDSEIFFFGVNQFGSAGRIPLTFKVTKRAIPTVTIDNATFNYYAVQGSGSNGSASFTVNSYSTDTMGISSSGAGANTSWWTAKNADGYVDASAEL
jgi:hypothetical protein